MKVFYSELAVVSLDFDNCHFVPPDDDVEDCENKAGVPAGLGN